MAWRPSVHAGCTPKPPPVRVAGQFDLGDCAFRDGLEGPLLRLCGAERTSILLRAAGMLPTRSLDSEPMADALEFGTLDVTDFTVGAMLRAGIAIRRSVRGAASLESAAEVIVRYLYDHCVDVGTGERSCAMVRFYKTHPFGALEPEQQRFASAQLGDTPPADGMRCLTLLATAGDEPAWNSRHESRGHAAIPLPTAERVRAAPMVTRLIEQLGLDLESVVAGSSLPTRGPDARTYEVFHVEDALASPFIPAQREFVIPHRIASVVGFGGLLRSGELFAVVLFSHARIPARSAARFRTIALDVRSSLFSFDETNTWSR